MRTRKRSIAGTPGLTARARAVVIALAVVTALAVPPLAPAPAHALPAGSAASARSAGTAGAAAAAITPNPEIEDFNRRFAAAGLRMDNAAVMELYADDSVSLLPGMDAMVSRKTIAAWLDDLLTHMPGYRVTRNDVDFRDIRIAGEWASEWGTTHQVVQPPGGKPPIETRGKILLVLHRETPGGWKIVQEMWNAAPAAPPS